MPLSPRVKRIATTAGALAVLIASLVMILTPVLLERWLNNFDLQSAFHKATGGSISTGTIRLDLFPAPHLTIPSGAIDLPEFASGRWQEIRIQPALISIFSDRVRFRKLKIIAPDLRLNTQFLFESDEQPVSGAMGELTSERLHRILLAASRQMGLGIQWLAGRAPDAKVDIRRGRLLLIENAALPPLAFHAIDARLKLPPDSLRVELDCKSSLLEALRITGEVDAATLVGQLTMWFNRLDSSQLAEITGLGRSLARIEGHMSGHATVDLKGADRIESHLSFRLPHLLLQRLETPVTIKNAFLDGTATFDETSFRFDLGRLYAEQPKVNLTGHFQAGGDSPGLRLHLVGSRIDIAEARQATLAVVGDHSGTTKIFDVLRAGNVPWISWRTEGPRLSDLKVFRNMKLTGEVQSGELYIPAADLQLTDVNGIADIDEGILRGEGLSARHITTTGQAGKLWIDFKPEDLPFFLEIDTHLQDVGLLPSRLRQWVGNTGFRNELGRLTQLGGEARGMMILDSRRGEGLEVTADVVECRIAGRYDRLPWEVNIDSGLVRYTNDRISLDQMTGSIGPSVFKNLKARVDFGDDFWLRVESLRSTVDLDAVLPWLMSFEALRTRMSPYRFTGTRAEIERLSLQGPFLAPSRWAYAVKGHVEGLTVEGGNLPAPLDFSDFALVANEDSLTAEGVTLKVLDADLTGRAHTTIAAGRLQSVDLVFKGQLGGKVDKWLNDLFEEDADFFLTQAPLTVSEAKLSWSADQPIVSQAAFTTSQDVQVSLSSTWQPQVFRQHHVRIVDGETQAVISQHRRADQLGLTFEGTLTGKTLDRLLLSNPFPSGRLKGDFQANIDLGRPEQSTASGNLTAANIRLPLKIDRKVHLSQLQLSANDNRLELSPAAFLIDDSWHTLEGSIRLASMRYHVDLQHEGAFFNVAPTEETQDGQARIERLLSWPVDGKIHSRLSALKWGEQRWVPLHTTLRMTPGRWQVALDEAGLCGIQTTGTVWLENGRVAVDLNHTAHKVALNPTISCLLGKSDLVDGRFNLEGQLAGEAASAESLSRSLEGQFNFEAEDGRIYKFDLLGRILAAINLTELVRGKKSDLLGEGLAYRKIAIEAQLEDGRLRFDKALIDGASAEIAAEGDIDLNSDELDLLVLVAPLKTVDAIVKFTPIVNTWLEGTLISIPVKVSGSLEEPRITPLAPSAVGSSLLNLLKNTIKLPIKLVEPLFEEEDAEASPPEGTDEAQP